MRDPEPLDPLALANALRPVLLRIARELRRESHAFGVTASQVTLLARIRENAGIGVRQLAALEGVSAPNISTHIRRLEQAGLIVRQRLPDGRRVGLHVSQEALAVLQSVRSRRTAWLASRLRHLPPEQLAALSTALHPLTQLLVDDADEASS